MPRCGCAGEVCACSVVAGNGVTITGVGSKSNPYEIAASSALDVSKDGNLVVDEVVRINFTGAGVATTKAGTGLVTVNIPGGAAPGPAPAGVPIGTIAMWPTATPPTGWLICNGTAIDSGLYPDLITLIGPNVPDLRNRVPMGASPTKGIKTTGGTNLTETVTGRAEPAVKLVVANLPPHQHTIAHNHDLQVEWLTSAPITGTTRNVVDAGNATGASGANTADGNTKGANTASSGEGAGSQALINIAMPYMALNYVIKAVT